MLSQAETPTKKLAFSHRSLELIHKELIARLNCLDSYFYSASISQYESGRVLPFIPVLLRYARLAIITLDALIDYEIDPPSSLRR